VIEIVHAGAHDRHRVRKVGEIEREVAVPRRDHPQRLCGMADVALEILEEKLSGRSTFRVRENVEVRRVGQFRAIDLYTGIAVIHLPALFGASNPHPGSLFDRRKGQLEIVRTEAIGELPCQDAGRA